MMFRRVGYLIFALLFYAPTSVGTQNALTIYTEQFPPYNFYENNHIKGINIDILKKACGIAKVECSFELYPWRRAFNLTLNNHQSGLVSTSRLPTRENQFLWVGPLVSSPACFYRLASRNDIKIDHREQLKNYTLGLNKGDVYEQILNGWGLKEHQHYINYGEKFGDVKAFKQGKLDLFIASANTLAFHIASQNLALMDVRPAFVITDTKLGGNYLALNKSIDSAVVKRLQSAVDHLWQNKHVAKIKQTYLHSYNPEIEESELSLQKRCMH